MNESTFTLIAHDLSRQFGQYAAVQGIEIELKQGEVLGLLGPNGAGKSTTMQMLSGNLAPTRGSIQICGIDLLDHPEAAKQNIGYLPEIPPLYKELTVDEYLQFVAKLHRVESSKILGALARVKDRCGLNQVGKNLLEFYQKVFSSELVSLRQSFINPK